MSRFPFLMLFSILLSCQSSSVDLGSANGGPPEMETDSSKADSSEGEFLSGEDLQIWSNVDSTSEWNAQAIACLRRFFDRKMHTNEGEDFWLASDVEKYRYPYSDIRYVEYDSEGRLRFPPTLMSIRPTEDEGQAVMTVKWAAKDSTGTDADIRYVFDFLALSTPDGVRLASPLDYNTREWERRTVGSVEYIISPLHTFSETDARQQAEDIERMATFFDVSEVPITFYSYADPTDLFRAWGFQHHTLMYVHESGGRVDHGGHLHSGNDRDIYTHEVAHIYSEERFGERPALLDEGLATILGGSTERPYEWHRENMEFYLANDTAVDLSGRCNPYIQDYINEHTNIPYMVGALLCERIVRMKGKEGLFEVMSRGEDPWPALEEYGVSQENVTEVVRDEVRKEMVSVY